MKLLHGCGANVSAEYRSDGGVLELVLHSDGGSLVMNGDIDRQLAIALMAAAADRRTSALIVTGTGDTFSSGPGGCPRFDPAALEHQRMMRLRLLDVFSRLRLPTVAAINGPVAPGADYLILFDVILAVESASFAERPRVEAGVFLGGDPTEPTDPTMRGAPSPRPASAVMSATEAKQWGFINEIVPKSLLLPKAREIAAYLAVVGVPD